MENFLAPEVQMLQMQASCDYELSLFWMAEPQTSKIHFYTENLISQQNEKFNDRILDALPKTTWKRLKCKYEVLISHFCHLSFGKASK